MGAWKSLFDRMREKKDELQRKAVKKAARTAIDSAGKAVERVLFGKLDDDEGEKLAEAEQEKPDPFAKLKAAEAEKKEREREEKLRAKERARARDQLEKDVDADLAELKKKLGK
jgi:hypothetical protein